MLPIGLAKTNITLHTLKLVNPSVYLKVPVPQALHRHNTHGYYI
jgi:hypothetical protein